VNEGRDPRHGGRKPERESLTAGFMIRHLF